MVASAYEIKGDGNNRFRVMAYDRAATAVEHATSEVKDLWDDQKLTTLAGVGTNIAQYLDELFRTGKVKHFEQVLKSLPPAMFEFLSLPGIGAKTAFKLCQELKIKEAKSALTKLKKAAQAGKISQIEGFGAESEKAILAGIAEVAAQGQRKGRLLLPFAWELGQKIIAHLKKEPTIIQIDPLGSLRRMVATVGDVDLAVSIKDPKRAIEQFLAYPGKEKVLASGTNTARILVRGGHQIDLKTQKPSAYGALLQHFTGSKQHNIHLREIAQKKGLSLSEYGIKSKGKIQACATEEVFYRRLGMKWIPPELRENAGEIEAAQKDKLPQLVALEEIKGDLHLHSDFPIEPSHDEGEDSLETMVKRGIKLGYEYLGFSEHNPSLSKHSENKVVDLIKKKKEAIEKINYSFKKVTRKEKKTRINVISGLEVDIRPAGKLALPEKALKLLDYVVVSVHSSFRMDKQAMTDRVLRAIEHPKVKILGHPTGRKLGQREGFELDWAKIFTACQKQGIALEINGWPDRLDLPDSLVREAVKIGVKMVINTDAHALAQMDYMLYGVSVARRGWAEKKDIINTLAWQDLKNWLR